MTASKNQLQLVVLKLQLLEDELGKLYKGVERYCNDIIHKGAESISRRGTRDEAINEFLVAYESTLRFIKEKIKQMESFTRVPNITQRVTKTGPSETPMYKVITNLETLRDLKRQFQQMINNLRSEMMSMGKRFIKSQDPKRLTNDVQNLHQDGQPLGMYDDRSDNDEFRENSIPRRASLDVRSNRDKLVTDLDTRRGSLDLRSSRDSRRQGAEVRNGLSQRFKSAFQPQYPRMDTPLESQVLETAGMDDVTTPGQKNPVPVQDITRLGFSDVNQHLESCLLFVMHIRSEFGEHEPFNIEDILSMFEYGPHKQLLTLKPDQSLTTSSQQSQSLEILEKRIGVLEALVRAKKLQEEIVPKTQQVADADNPKVKSQTVEGSDSGVSPLEEQLQALSRDYDNNMPRVKKSIAMIVQEIEELNDRFHSFQRIFAASKSENQRMLSTIGRRMSDVVEFKDNNKRLSGGEGVDREGVEFRRLSTPDGSQSGTGGRARRDDVATYDNGDDVFELEVKSPVDGDDKETTEMTMRVAGAGERVERDRRSFREVEESLMARLRDETKKDVAGAVEQIKEIDSKLQTLQALQMELMKQISSSPVPKEDSADSKRL